MFYFKGHVFFIITDSIFNKGLGIQNLKIFPNVNNVNHAFAYTCQTASESLETMSLNTSIRFKAKDRMKLHYKNGGILYNKTTTALTLVVLLTLIGRVTTAWPMGKFWPLGPSSDLTILKCILLWWLSTLAATKHLNKIDQFLISCGS